MEAILSVTWRMNPYPQRLERVLLQTWEADLLG